MSNYSFKPLDNNKYEMLYKGDSFGITFITPNDYSMDDYKNSINFSEVKDLKACKDVVIGLKDEMIIDQKNLGLFSPSGWA